MTGRLAIIGAVLSTCLIIAFEMAYQAYDILTTYEQGDL